MHEKAVGVAAGMGPGVLSEKAFRCHGELHARFAVKAGREWLNSIDKPSC